MRLSRNAIGAMATILLVLATSPNLLAGTFSWGDLADPAGTVMYLGVEENNASATSLFTPEPGTGSPVVAGNSIRFDRQNFLASSTSGTQTTTSTVDMTLMARPGSSVENLLVRELGDYTLSGVPSSSGSASVSGTFTWTILEVNNAPITLPAQVQFLQATTGSGANGGQFARPGDDGTAIAWNGSALLDFSAYLAANSITGSATKVLVEFENELEATAVAGSNAFIKKKEIGGFAISANVTNVPEPSTLVLFATLATGAGLRRRRVAG